MKKAPSPGKLKEDSGQRLGPKQRVLTPREAENQCMKVKAAQALGLWDKVKEEGWGALTAAESGRVGGWMTRERAKTKR